MFNARRFGLQQMTPHQVAKGLFTPKTSSLFARAAATRRLSDAPQQYRYVLGQAGVGLGRLDALPDFSAQDVGAANDLLTSQFLPTLNPLIQQALQVQASTAPLLTRPDATKLASAVSALESSIKNAWGVMMDALQTVNQRRQELSAAQAEPEPNPNNYHKYGVHWPAYFSKDMEARQGRINAAQNNVTGATNYAVQKRDEAASWLRRYNSEVPAAADLVTRASTIEQKAVVVAQELAVAKEEQVATGVDTQTFVLQQQLDQLKQAAELAKRDANRAASEVAKGTGGKLPFIIGGGLLLAGAAWWWSRRK